MELWLFGCEKRDSIDIRMGGDGEEDIGGRAGNSNE